MLICVLTIIFEIFKPMAKYSGALSWDFLSEKKPFQWAVIICLPLIEIGLMYVSEN